MARRKKGDPVHGWLILDKPEGVTSTRALAIAKRLFNARKAGHAGTLDPLATGLLPVAFGEATKTVSYVVDGMKSYDFSVRWGQQTDTDDSQGSVVEEKDERPTREEIEAVLDQFVGEITQVPPQFSAIKVDGNRAYDLARDGEQVELKARTVLVEGLSLLDCPDANSAIFRADCGKGTYVRALARDLGQVLGCLGHVTALRRTKVGPFDISDAITLEALEAAADEGRETLMAHLLSVEHGLSALPGVRIEPSDAALLARGQPVLVRGRDAPIMTGPVYAISKGRLVALAEMDRGALRPTRVFNFASNGDG
jgi:tRNA pseudouridine55 synthase